MPIKFYLASSSPYRKALLAKIIHTFECFTPNIDESPRINESPLALVKRLSLSKALALSNADNDHIVIASDQIAVCDGNIIGKPQHYENAVTQLRSFSGRKVQFLTGLCVHQPNVKTVTTVESVEVHFRALSDAQIDAYLKYEKPYDCAGSFKCEGYGIALFEKIIADDPNTLIGLPLIRLTEILYDAFKYCVFEHQNNV